MPEMQPMDVTVFFAASPEALRAPLRGPCVKVATDEDDDIDQGAIITAVLHALGRDAERPPPRLLLHVSDHRAVPLQPGVLLTTSNGCRVMNLRVLVQVRPSLPAARPSGLVSHDGFWL
eukprot:SM000148S01057  [mRNA]  locus=s148:368558:368914:- [translate_table: standard]